MRERERERDEVGSNSPLRAVGEGKQKGNQVEFEKERLGWATLAR